MKTISIWRKSNRLIKAALFSGLLVQHGKAQSSLPLTTGFSFSGGVSVNYTSVTEKIFSALPFKSVNGGAAVGIAYASLKMSYTLNMFYSTGTLKPDVQAQGSQHQIYSDVDFTSLYKIPISKPHAFVFSPGASINLLYTKRDYSHFINSDQPYTCITSLGLAAGMTYSCSGSLRRLHISELLESPVLSYSVLPAFGSQGNGSNDHQLMSFGSYFRLKSSFSLIQEISNHQRISLSYIWDYYEVRHPGDIQQASHILGFAYHYTL